MRVVVTGSSGLIGSALLLALQSEGHTVLRMLRKPADSGSTIFWAPDQGKIDAKALEGVDAVVHLAGESIAKGRWTKEKKKRIRESRIQGTTLLSKTIASLAQRPAVLISSSALGYYGDRGVEVLTEMSEPGTGFLADVCKDWEASTQAASECGVRVVNLRTGIVLSPRGGALAEMLPFFRWGLGGKLGSGNQYMSWIDLDDMVRIIQFALATPSLQGPVNSVSAEPVSNSDFTHALGCVLRRPTVFAVPAPAAKLKFGEMAEALLLSSARLHPARLVESGFEFHYPEIQGALYHELT